MPEYRECWAHWYLLCYFRWKIFADKSWDVVALWADHTSNERKKRKIRPHQTGLVEVTPGKRLPRGSRHAQTELCPPGPIAGLELVDIQTTARAIILNFGDQYLLKFAWLLHTSPQVYTKKVWEEQIKPESSQNRIWKIALAIEFEEHVVVFISRDLMVQPTWVKKEDGFPQPNPPDVYDEFIKFLEGVTSWAAERQGSDQNGLASSIVRDSEHKDIWHGLGVYSTSEVFVIAGLSLALTEAEVFGNASRLARLCAAYYAFAARARKDDAIWNKLVKPSIRSGILAPTRTERLGYADWLLVWGKQRTLMPKRCAEIIGEYRAIINARTTQADQPTQSEAEGESNPEATTGSGSEAAVGDGDEDGDEPCVDLEEDDDVWEEEEEETVWYRDHPDLSALYDPYEPTFMRDALEHPDFAFLKPLIFGEDSTSNDPLTAYFKQAKIPHGRGANTFLKPEVYVPLFDDSIPSRKWSHRETYTYRIGKGNGGKHMWTLVPSFPKASRPSVDYKLPSPANDVFWVKQVVDKKKKQAVDKKKDQEEDEKKDQEEDEKSKKKKKKRRITWGNQRSRLFWKHIVETNDVGVGALEYCANGYISKGVDGKTHIFAFRGDQGIPDDCTGERPAPHFAEKILRGFHWRSEHHETRRQRGLPAGRRRLARNDIKKLHGRIDRTRQSQSSEVDNSEDLRDVFDGTPAVPLPPLSSTSDYYASSASGDESWATGSHFPPPSEDASSVHESDASGTLPQPLSRKRKKRESSDFFIIKQGSKTSDTDSNCCFPTQENTKRRRTRRSGTNQEDVKGKGKEMMAADSESKHGGDNRGSDDEDPYPFVLARHRS